MRAMVVRDRHLSIPYGRVFQHFGSNALRIAHVRGHRCELISRNGHTINLRPQLADEIAHAVRAQSVVLDGEICCLTLL